MVRILLQVDDEHALVRLHADGAPRAVARLVAALPIRTTLRQSRWSGESTYAAVAELRWPADQTDRTAVPLERPATFMCPGRIYTGAFTGGIGLPYGAAQSRDFGLNTWITEVGALEGDHSRLLAVLSRIRREGPKGLLITVP